MGSFKVYRNKRWAWLYTLSWMVFVGSLGLAAARIAERSPGDVSELLAAAPEWLPWTAGISLLLMIATGRSIRPKLRTDTGGINVRTRTGWRRISWDQIRDFDFRLEGLQQSGVVDLRDGTSIPLRWVATREPIEQLTALLDEHRRPMQAQPAYVSWATPAEFAPPIGPSAWYPANEPLPPTESVPAAAGGRLGAAWTAGPTTLSGLLDQLRVTGTGRRRTSRKARNPVTSAMGILFVVIFVGVQLFSALDSDTSDDGQNAAPPATGYAWWAPLRGGALPADLIADGTGVVTAWQRSSRAPVVFVNRLMAADGDPAWEDTLGITAGWADLAPAPGDDFFVAYDYLAKNESVVAEYTAGGDAVWSQPLIAEGPLSHPRLAPHAGGVVVAADVAPPSSSRGAPGAVFLQGLDPRGEPTWTWKRPADRWEASSVVAVAASDRGDIYLVTNLLARAGDTWDVRSQTLRHFSPDGVLQWEKAVPAGNATGIKQIVADGAGVFAILRRTTGPGTFQDSLLLFGRRGNEQRRWPYDGGFSLQDLEPAEGGGVWVLAMSAPNDAGERFSGLALWSEDGTERWEHSFWWSPGTTTQVAIEGRRIYLGGSLGGDQAFVGLTDERIPAGI